MIKGIQNEYLLSDFAKALNLVSRTTKNLDAATLCEPEHHKLSKTVSILS